LKEELELRLVDGSLRWSGGEYSKKAAPTRLKTLRVR
jgi:hypothetical protein